MQRLPVVMAVLAATTWLVSLRSAPTPDEAGFLMVAAQWHDGSSLYGDYWVDRPPVLLAWYGLADAAGGLLALRVTGMVVVAVCVLLGGRLGRLATGGSVRAGAASAASVAVLTSNPLLGGGYVDGELLALPPTLAGIGLLLAARVRRNELTRWALLTGAGAAGALAALTKQNFLDVLVMALVLVPAMGAGSGRAVARLIALMVGAGATVAVVVGIVGAWGTTPVELWNAVVTFRWEAAQVIGSSATDDTPLRGARLVGVLLLSGAGPLIAVAGWQAFARARQIAPDLRLAAAVLLLWEIGAAVAGGSYWLHYLMGLVPAITLLVALAVGFPPTHARPVRRALRYSAAVTAASLAWAAGAPPYATSAAATYLREHSQPDDTAVVAYGKPDILYEARLDSPYPLLWSLPVRVLDPSLTQLEALLGSTQRPTWIVTGRSGLSSWGIEPDPGVVLSFARHYVRVAVADGMRIYRRLDRPPPPTSSPPPARRREDHAGWIR